MRGKRVYPNPPKANAEGRYECRYGCGKSFPREWECGRHEEVMCKRNAERKERPRLPCEYNCGRSYVRPKDRKAHENNACLLNPNSKASKAQSGQETSEEETEEKSKRGNWYAKFGDLKPDADANFLCRWCGQDYGRNKASCRMHEQYKCKANELVVSHRNHFCCRYSCGMNPDGFCSALQRDNHEKTNCWRNLTSETGPAAQEKGRLLRSALQQLGSLDVLRNDLLEWDVGAVENPLNSHLTYVQWVAVFVLQEAPAFLLEGDKMSLDNNDDEEQWICPPRLGIRRYEEPTGSTPTHDLSSRLCINKVLNTTSIRGFVDLPPDQKEYMELDGVDASDQGLVVETMGDSVTDSFEEDDYSELEMEGDLAETDCQISEELSIDSILRSNCENMDRLGSWDCPWDEEERFCEGARFMHGFVVCPKQVLLQLDNCATPYKSHHGRIEWKPQCRDCYYLGKRIGMWMWKWHVDEDGQRICHAARTCGQPVLEPYYTCKRHYEASRASLKKSKTRKELLNVKSTSRQSYGKPGYEISTATQMKQFLAGKTTRPRIEWLHTKEALLDNRGAYHGRLLFVDTEFCNNKLTRGPPILLEVAIVNDQGNVILQTVINHEMTIGDLVKKAKIAWPHGGRACVEKIYGKLSEAMTPGLTLHELADTMTDLGVPKIGIGRLEQKYHRLPCSVQSLVYGRKTACVASEGDLAPATERMEEACARVIQLGPRVVVRSRVP